MKWISSRAVVLWGWFVLFPAWTDALPPHGQYHRITLTSANADEGIETATTLQSCANASLYSYKDAHNYILAGRDVETTQLELSLNITRVECEEGVWCLVNYSSSQDILPLEGNWTEEDLLQHRMFIANNEPNAQEQMASAVTDSCQAGVQIWISLHCDKHRTDPSMPTCTGDHVNVALQNLTLNGTQTCNEVAIAASLKLGYDLTDFNAECACAMQIINLTTTALAALPTAAPATAAVVVPSTGSNSSNTADATVRLPISDAAATASRAMESLVWTGLLAALTTTSMLLLGVLLG
jgi:hypothetical protein